MIPTGGYRPREAHPGREGGTGDTWLRGPPHSAVAAGVAAALKETDIRTRRVMLAAAGGIGVAVLLIAAGKTAASGGAWPGVVLAGAGSRRSHGEPARPCRRGAVLPDTGRSEKVSAPLGGSGVTLR